MYLLCRGRELTIQTTSLRVLCHRHEVFQTTLHIFQISSQVKDLPLLSPIRAQSSIISHIAPLPSTNLIRKHSPNQDLITTGLPRSQRLHAWQQRAPSLPKTHSHLRYRHSNPSLYFSNPSHDLPKQWYPNPILSSERQKTSKKHDQLQRRRVGNSLSHQYGRDLPSRIRGMRNK